MNFRLNKSNYILFTLLFLIIVSQVYTSNRLATCGQEISLLEQLAQNIEDENRKLLAENVEDLSLTELKIKAEELGFIEPETVINLSSQTNLALR